MSDSALLGDASRQILFLHANGFPTGVYQQFLASLGGFAKVHAPDVILTPLNAGASRRWPQMTEQVVVQIKQLATAQKPVTLVGHSMGGYLSLMAAARLNNLVDAIVLIDSAMVQGWRRSVFETLKVAGLSKYGGPAPIAARRRFQWPSSQEARDHFSPKAFTRHWAPGVLDDFIEHGLVKTGSTDVALRIAREVESDIYAQLPSQRTSSAYKKLRSRGMPIFMIAGKRSVEMRMAGLEHNRQLFHGRWTELPTAHLIPMELPQACAQAVADCLAQAGPHDHLANRR